MNVILWLIFGAIVGWVASLITSSDKRFGGLANIVIGILGAAIGGYLSRFVGSSGVTGFNVMSFLVALVGAVILLVIVNMFSHQTH